MYSSSPLEACVFICHWLGPRPNTQTCTGWLWDICLGTHLFQYPVILPLSCQQIQRTLFNHGESIFRNAKERVSPFFSAPEKSKPQHVNQSTPRNWLGLTYDKPTSIPSQASKAWKRHRMSFRRSLSLVLGGAWILPVEGTEGRHPSQSQVVTKIVVTWSLPFVESMSWVAELMSYISANLTEATLWGHSFM